jgi:NADPH2:quinone reductase
VARVFEFSQTGGPEQLALVERDVPPPGPKEVQVDIRATGLNRAELMLLAGQYLVDPVLPSKIGMEGAGVITAFGSDVSGWGIGFEVCITPNLEPDKYGVLGEKVNVPEACLQPKPANVSFKEAAAFWMAYPTAYGGLVNAGGLREGGGQVVLISAASSSVGIAAIQIASAHGATCIATTRTRAKAEWVRSVGAHHVIVTDEENLAERVHEITNGKGFDIAFDPVAGPMVEALGAAAAPGATIVEYGILSGEVPTLPLFPMLFKGFSITAFHVVFHLFAKPELFDVACQHLLPRWKNGQYKPLIDETFAFDDAVKAYEHLASNAQFGKVVIERA